ncbi:UNVERIFIED_CONTAM: hypothetical protein PYX00_000998 [Menopon gallinae]|uniref:Uncharacterized protein n=1 Tax=Menopon gallinae TaxID=328185 RepID=A0AAW2IB50_9NEOP
MFGTGQRRERREHQPVKRALLLFGTLIIFLPFSLEQDEDIPHHEACRQRNVPTGSQGVSIQARSVEIGRGHLSDVVEGHDTENEIGDRLRKMAAEGMVSGRRRGGGRGTSRRW